MKYPPSQFTRDLAAVDRTQFHARAAVLCLPAMALALAAGLRAHLPPAAIVAASGTLTVAFGSFRRLQGSRLLSMLLTATGIGAAAMVGTLAGFSPGLTLLLAGAMGLLYGLALTYSEDGSWIALQCTIAFLVATAFPALGFHAFLRGIVILAGGLLQAVLLLVFWRVNLAALREDARRCDPRRVARILWHDVRPVMVRHLDHARPELRYAVRLGATLMLAVLLARTLHQINSYWLPMTTLIVLKPDFYRTYTSCVARIFGTFLGIGLASLLTHLVHPGTLMLCVLVLCFGWATLATQKVNYAIFSCALTAFIVFLVAISGLPETTVTANRLLDTALGSVLALLSRMIGPRWDSVMPISETAPAVPNKSPALAGP